MKTLIVLFLLLLGKSVYSEVWLQGAAAVLEVDGDVSVAVRGTDISYDAVDPPIYFPGAFSSNIRGGGSAFFYTSNGVALRFTGEGVFSMNRFESLASTPEKGGPGASENLGHMILNMRRGKLLIDNRSLSENSKFLVETPIGRVSLVKGVFFLEIIHDPRSSIYNFSIACARGAVRFTDLNNEPYLIYAGQQIVGSGTYSSPSVGIGAQPVRVREKLMAFTEALSLLDENPIDQSKLGLHMTELKRPEYAPKQAESLALPESHTDNSRPIVIEYAPGAEPVSPLRAEVQPPAQSNADSFITID